MSPLRLALLDLSRRPLSSLIAIVSIALSVATAGVLLRLSNMAERRFATVAHGAEAIVGAKSGDLDILLGALNGEVSAREQTGYLPMKLYESLRAQAPVQFEDGAKDQPVFIQSISPFVYAGWLGRVPCVGTDDSIMARAGLRLEDGSFPSATAELAVGSVLAHDLGLHVGSVVQVDPLAPALKGTGPEPDASVLGKSLPFRVTAVLASTGCAWDRLAWMTLPSARVLLTHTRLRNSIWGVDALNYFLIDLKGPAGSSASAGAENSFPGNRVRGTPASKDESFVRLKALVDDRTVGQVVRSSDALEHLQRLTGTGRDLGLTIVGLVLAMAVLSLASVLITRFESLSLQLAVLRAIGYSRSELALWLLLEGLILGFVACVFGAVLDGGCFPLIRSALGESLPQVPSSLFESTPVWIAALVATALSVVIPIVRAYRQDVHSSLRA